MKRLAAVSAVPWFFRFTCGLMWVSLSSAWVAPFSIQTLHLNHRLHRTSSSSVTVCNLSLSDQDLTDKVVHQRVRHRLSPQSDVSVQDALVIEERIRFIPDEDRDGYLVPVGRRTLSLLDGTSGEEFYRMNVHERNTHSHNGLLSIASSQQDLASTLALILYLVSNPNLMKGNVLELESKLGLASLLASIGLAHHVDQDEQRSQPKDDVDLLLPFKGRDKVPMTSAVDHLTLTDVKEADLDVAFQNVQHCNVPSEKVTLETLDWRRRSSTNNRRRRSAASENTDASKNMYRTILGADLEVTYPTAKELAHTVAHLLLPTEGVFVHVAPDNRDDLSQLHKLLRQGYLMQVTPGYLKLVSTAYHYQVLPDTASEEELSPPEQQAVKETTYESLTAYHHVDYDGFNGEYLFPMETGAYEDGNSQTSLETDFNAGPGWA